MTKVSISAVTNFIKRKSTKKLFAYFLLIFAINVLIISIMMVLPGAHSVNGAFFDSDSTRVFSDMTIRDYNHYRAMVHPLFVFFTQPIVLVFSKILSSKLIAAVLIQALVGAINIILFFVLARRMIGNKKIATLATAVFALLFSQIVFAGIFETYLYAQFGLLAMWAYLSYRSDKALNVFDYLIIAILGLLTIGVTVTNFVQYIIFLAVLILCNKKESHKVLKTFMIGVSVVAVAVLLSQVQNIIWPSAPEFFKGNVTGFLKKESEEFIYIDKKITLTKISNQIQANTVGNFPISVVMVDNPNQYFGLNVTLIARIVGFLMFGLFATTNLLFMFYNRSNLFKKHKIYLAMLAAYGFNFLLHIIYGNTTTFLYTPHYNFLLVLTLFYSVVNLKDKLRIKNIFSRYGMGWFCFFCSVQVVGLIAFLRLMISNLGIESTIPNKLVAVILVAVGVALFLLTSGKKWQQRWPLIITVLSSVLFGLVSINHWVDNTDVVYENGLVRSGDDKKAFLQFPDGKNALRNLSEYYRELDIKLIEQHNFSYFEKTNRQAANFFFFGMADRRKMVYKNGKIYDLFTQEIIKQWDIKEELIVPNSYQVLLIDNNNQLINIYEDKTGVYVKVNDDKELLASGNDQFNLPDFANKKYKNILKVLHQEILFHFYDGVPKPNILTYKDGGGWYRDNMIAAMALEKTDNVHLLEKWVASLTDIYDYQRSADMQEADNPGELLYILGAVKNERQDLVDKIKLEVATKAENGHFSGICDGVIQTYYPTALLMAGAQKAKVDLPVQLRLPDNDDVYGRITWWYSDQKLRYNKAWVSRSWPYLEWAQAHYYPYNSPHILNEAYPLTYEAELTPEIADRQRFYTEFYADQKISASHIWHAAEMFLTLLEY